VTHSNVVKGREQTHTTKRKHASEKKIYNNKTPACLINDTVSRTLGKKGKIQKRKKHKHAEMIAFSLFFSQKARRPRDSAELGASRAA